MESKIKYMNERKQRICEREKKKKNNERKINHIKNERRMNLGHWDKLSSKLKYNLQTY